ncbi:hypothetical protein XENTR_v10018535 [Xenopus tropicalis]|nr:hypothetical protein XENTR_v10018535 [Xenopus tropicalis]
MLHEWPDDLQLRHTKFLLTAHLVKKYLAPYIKNIKKLLIKSWQIWHLFLHFKVYFLIFYNKSHKTVTGSTSAQT